MDNKTLGARLKRIRTAYGLSQADMATKLGFGVSGSPIVSKIESGSRKLSAQELHKWCSACDVSTEDVLSGRPLSIEIPGEVVA